MRARVTRHARVRIRVRIRVKFGLLLFILFTISEALLLQGFQRKQFIVYLVYSACLLFTPTFLLLQGFQDVNNKYIPVTDFAEDQNGNNK